MFFILIKVRKVYRPVTRLFRSQKKNAINTKYALERYGAIYQWKDIKYGRMAQGDSNSSR